MIERFISTLKKEGLYHTNVKTLIGASGGMDSMVLCDLYHRAGLPFAIAHFNFKLRAEESEKDEELVKNVAEIYNVKFHSESSSADKFAERNKISLQEAARIQRYDFFEKVLSEFKYGWIAVAHHRDDNIETVLLNIISGTGFKGLSGMKIRRDKIIRPLINSTREEIQQYAEEHDIEFREDSSNSSIKYDRNRLRLDILPSIDDWKPSFRQVMHRNIEGWQEMLLIYERYVDQLKRKYLEERGTDLYLHLNRLKKDGYGRALLFELTKQFGFNPRQLEDILEHDESGKQIFSDSYRMIRDRGFLIITSQTQLDQSALYLSEGDQQIQHNGKKIKITSAKAPFKLDRSGSKIQLDKSRLSFPLVIRKWKKGYYFYPLWLTKSNSSKPGKKKISDYLIDKKIPLHQKEQCSIILSDSKVCGIIGHQVDERFKVGSSTTEILTFEVIV